MGMQIDVAELAGIIIEGILYGMFVILTALSLYILLSRSRRGGAKVNKPMVVTSLLMFALATSQVIVDCIAMFDPFIKMTRPERIAEFKNNSLPINASKHGIFFTMMLLGDAIVIYRCFIIWGRRWLVIVLPALLSVASGAIAYMTVWASEHLVEGKEINKRAYKLGVVLLTFSLAANVTATSLIAYRVWKSETNYLAPHDPVGNHRTEGGLKTFLRVTVESGVLNIGYLCAYIGVLYSSKISGATAVVACLATPMVGIVFSLVIVQVGLRASQEAKDRNTSAAPLHVAHRKRSGSTGNIDGSGGDVELESVSA
jgi:magnesium-transporting ATPase (P-type)